MGIQEIQQLKQSEDSEHGQNLGKGVQQKKQLHDSRPAGETEPGKSAPLPLLTESRKAYSIGISPARHMLMKNRFKKARPIVLFTERFIPFPPSVLCLSRRKTG